MGGKKKRSIKKMARTQKRKPQKKKEGDEAPAKRKSVPGITPPNLTGDKLTGTLKNMKAITPYTIATRFNIRLSIARSLLKELERKGTIKFVSKSRNLRIYKPAA